MINLRLCCLSLWLAFAPALLAQQLEIAPFFGCRFGGVVQDPDTEDNFTIRAGPAYGLFLDFGPVNPELKIELLWSHQDTRVDLNGWYDILRLDLTVDQIQIGGITETGSDRFREYVSALVGATHYSTDYGSDTRFSMSLGIGGKYFPFRNVVVRADLRCYWTVVESEGAFIYHDGVTILAFSGSSLLQGEATIGVSIAF